MNRSKSLPQIFDLLDYLIDDRVGIVSSVRELARESGAPDFFHFHANTCNTSAFTPHQNFAYAGGASSKREHAMAKAIGEAIERYCSALYEMDVCPLHSFDFAPFPCVPPEQFALYSQEQYESTAFPYVPFVKSTPVRWTPLRELASNEVWYAPACMVFMPYLFDEACGEHPIGQRISTGLACHSSFAEAAVSAICEVIERDAFTICWQAGLGPPHIDSDSLSAENRDLVRRFERVGYSVIVLNITLDIGIPTILSVLKGKSSDRPALVFAASSSLDPEEAVRKSLEELAHTARLCNQLKASKPPLDPGDPYGHIMTQEDHVQLYCDHANKSLADFLFSSNQHMAFEEIKNFATGDPEKDLKVVVGKVHALWHRVLVADVTTPDVGNLGLRVVRAVIPGFHPLFMGYRNRALGGSRLWEVPQKLGYKGITRETGDNPAPHPYP